MADQSFTFEEATEAPDDSFTFEEAQDQSFTFEEATTPTPPYVPSVDSVPAMAAATRGAVSLITQAIAATDFALAHAPQDLLTPPTHDAEGRPFDPRGRNPSAPASDGGGLGPQTYGTDLGPLMTGLVAVRKAFSQGDQLAYLAEGQPEGNFKEGLKLAAGAVQGAEDVVGGGLEFMTSPVGAATMGLGAAPGILRALASGAFAIDMARHAPESLKAYQDAAKAGDKVGQSRALVSGLGNLAMAGLAASHSYKQAHDAIVGPLTPAEAGARALLEVIDHKATAKASTELAREQALEATDPKYAGLRASAPHTAEAVKVAIEGDPNMVSGKVSIVGEPEPTPNLKPGDIVPDLLPPTPLTTEATKAVVEPVDTKPPAPLPSAPDMPTPESNVPAFAQKYPQETLFQRPAWVEPGSAFDVALGKVRDAREAFTGVDVTGIWESLTPEQRQDLVARGWQPTTTRVPGQVVLNPASDALAARNYYGVQNRIAARKLAESQESPPPEPKPAPVSEPPLTKAPEPRVDIDQLKSGAPFQHPKLGEVWIDKITPTHVSFSAQVGDRRFGKFKYSREEFATGVESAEWKAGKKPEPAAKAAEPSAYENVLDFIKTLDALTPGELDNVRRTLRANIRNPERLAALKEGFTLTNQARHQTADANLDLAKHLTEPAVDVAGARERVARADRRIAELRDDGRALQEKIKLAELKVMPARRSRFGNTPKKSAKKADLDEWRKLKKDFQALEEAIHVLDREAKPDRDQIDNAIDAEIINDPKQPLLRRLDRKIRKLENNKAPVPPELIKARDAEVKRAILEKYPDASPAEIKALTPRVMEGAYFGRDPWGLSNNPDLPGLRRAELDAEINRVNAEGPSGVSEALQADINKYSAAKRPFTEQRNPVEPLTRAALDDLTARIKQERAENTARFKKEQEESAAAAAAEKAQEAQLIAEAQKVVDSAKRVGTVGGRTAVEVKEELGQRILDELKKMVETDKVVLKKGAEEGDYAAEGDSTGNVALGTITKKESGKFEVDVSRPGFDGLKTTVDTLAEGEFLIKAMASAGRGAAIIAVPGDGVYRIRRSGDTLLKVWAEVKKLTTSGGIKREGKTPHRTSGGAEKPPGDIRTVEAWNNAKEFHGLEPSDKIASWSARLREFAEKVADETGKAVADVDVRDVEAWIKKKTERRDQWQRIREQGKADPSDQKRTTGKQSDPWEDALKGDESAFERLEEQLRNIYPDDYAKPDQSAWGRSNPNQVHTPEEFVKVFNKAFAARDFETILDTIKASELSVYKQAIRDFMKAQGTDPVAAAKAEWIRHVFAGTVPPDAIPRAKPPPPPPRPTPPPPSGGTGPRPRPGSPPPPGGAPPPPPRPPPAPPTPRIPVDPIHEGKAKSPYQILEDFQQAINKAFRVIRQGRGVLGMYQPGSTGVSQRFAGDLDTAAHELAGHWTDDKYGIGKPWVNPRTRSPYDSELAQFWIYGSVTPSSTLRYRRAEGIAEFIRAYVMNPSATRLQAPKFTEYFERTLPRDALGAILDFSKDVRTWAGADPLVRGELLMNVARPTLTQRLWQGLHGRGLGFETNWVDWFRQRFDDPYHYAVKAFKQAAELMGKKLLPQQDFELLARLLAGHDRQMSRQFENGLEPLRPEQRMNAKGQMEVVPLTDPVTKQPMTQEWLMETFDNTNEASFKQSKHQTAAFMVHQRTLKMAARLGRQSNISGAGAGLKSDVAEAREFMARVETDPGLKMLLEEGARRYRLWADTNLQMLVDSGRITMDRMLDIRRRNEHYVDMHRLSEEFDVGHFVSRQGAVGSPKTTINRFKGSTLQVDDVYANLLDQTDAIQREARRNVTMNAFVDSLRNVRSLHGPDLKEFEQFGVKVPGDNYNTLKVYRNGHLEHWKFNKDIYESLKGLSELGGSAIWTTVTAPSRLSRYLITHGPSFIVRNVLRDTVERSVNSITGGKPWDILKGYTEADLARFETFGGGQFGNYMRDRTTWNREIARATQELIKEKNTIVLNPLKLKHGWEAFAAKSETWGRLAEFRRAFERGKVELARDHPNLTPAELDYNAALWAAGQARGLIDFAKAGTWMRHINQAIPFSNAAMRGLGKSYTGITTRPLEYLMNWSMYVLAPTMALFAWNRSDEERWKEYQQLPGWRKDFFWNLKVGDIWVTYPKPHLLGVLAGGVERALVRASGDKRGLDEYRNSLKQSALPISDVAEASGPLKLAIELYANLDTFRDRPIVQHWEADLKLEKREGTKHATGVGQGVAGALNSTGLTIDPRQVDHVIRSLGGFGNIVANVSRPNVSPLDAGAKALGVFADVPGTDARDVRWVFNWAKREGKLNDPRINNLRKLRGAVYDAKTKSDRVEASKKLREWAAQFRDSLEAVAAE